MQFLADSLLKFLVEFLVGYSREMPSALIPYGVPEGITGKNSGGIHVRIPVGLSGKLCKDISASILEESRMNCLTDCLEESLVDFFFG